MGGELCGDVGWGGMSHQLRGVIGGEVWMCSTSCISLLLSSVGDSHGVSESVRFGLRLTMEQWH